MGNSLIHCFELSLNIVMLLNCRETQIAKELIVKSWTSSCCWNVFQKKKMNMQTIKFFVWWWPHLDTFKCWNPVSQPWPNFIIEKIIVHVHIVNGWLLLLKITTNLWTNMWICQLFPLTLMSAKDVGYKSHWYLSHRYPAI